MGYRNIPYTQEYSEELIKLKPDQCFYMASDGLTDQIGGERRRMMGKKKIFSVLNNKHLSMDEQKGKLKEALNEYQGDEERRDDISMIGFKF